VPEQGRPPEDEWLTVADVATELGVHPSTVRRWANEQVLRGTRIGRRQFRFRRSALQEFTEHRPANVESRVVPARDTGSLDPLALNSDADLLEPA